MGFFDKILNVMKLNGEDDYDDEYDDDDVYADESSLLNKKKTDEVATETSASAPAEKRTFNSSKITPLRSKKSGGSEPMEVCVFKPSSFEDAREIGETLLAKQTVILNMEGVDVALAQRIVDFASGSCFALEGNLQKVSNFIFVITPAQISISGDLQEIVNNFDFNGIKTGF